MNVMVSARVPVELRDQVSRKLQAAGATPTQLINAAYDEYARTGLLPGEQKVHVAHNRSERRLTKEQRSRLLASIHASTLDVVPSLIPNDYKSILSEGERGDYEALA